MLLSDYIKVQHVDVNQLVSHLLQHCITENQYHHTMDNREMSYSHGLRHPPEYTSQSALPQPSIILWLPSSPLVYNLYIINLLTINVGYFVKMHNLQ